jgi:hypothetical protein
MRRGQVFAGREAAGHFTSTPADQPDKATALGREEAAVTGFRRGDLAEYNDELWTVAAQPAGGARRSPTQPPHPAARYGSSPATSTAASAKAATSTTSTGKTAPWTDRPSRCWRRAGWHSLARPAPGCPPPCAARPADTTTSPNPRSRGATVTACPPARPSAPAPLPQRRAISWPPARRPRGPDDGSVGHDTRRQRPGTGAPVDRRRPP